MKTSLAIILLTDINQKVRWTVSGENEAAAINRIDIFAPWKLLSITPA